MIGKKWDIRFMRIAKEISSWSKDPSSKIGAVIVNDERHILATGYNGFPKGIDDTHERLNDRSKKYPLIIHAEMNALMNALYSGVSVRDATIYVYGLPVCPECAKSIIQSGINRVVISDNDREKDPSGIWTDRWEKQSKKMFSEANVETTMLHERNYDDK